MRFKLTIPAAVASVAVAYSVRKGKGGCESGWVALLCAKAKVVAALVVSPPSLLLLIPSFPLPPPLPFAPPTTCPRAIKICNSCTTAVVSGMGNWTRNGSESYLDSSQPKRILGFPAAFHTLPTQRSLATKKLTFTFFWAAKKSNRNRNSMGQSI